MKNVFKVVLIFTWIFCASMFLAIAKIDYAQSTSSVIAPSTKSAPDNTVTFGTSPEGQPEKPSTGPVLIHPNQNKIPVTLTVEDLALVILYTESDEHAEEILKSLPDDVLADVVQAMLRYQKKLEQELKEGQHWNKV